MLEEALEDGTLNEDVVYEKPVFAEIDVRVECDGSLEGLKVGRETPGETTVKTVGHCSWLLEAGGARGLKKEKLELELKLRSETTDAVNVGFGEVTFVIALGTASEAEAEGEVD